MLEREPGPGVREAERFPHDVERAARGAPPVSGIEGIIVGVVNVKGRLTDDELFPDEPRAAGVSLRRDEHDAVEAFGARGLGDFFHFILGVDDGLIEDADFFERHAELDEDGLVVESFADVIDAERMQFICGVRGASDPNLRGQALAEDFRGFSGAVGHAAAENDGDVA